MIINHNLAAMNAHRHFGLKVRNMDRNVESLASGERINRGADDAAGLAVSEKMRAQIRGLNQASRNIQDGVSLIQTTEGFLKESQSVLHRMRELIVQAANGTYTREDRAQITVELDQMIRELNRIHEDAKFNTLRLLDGKTLGENSFAILQPDGTYPSSELTPQGDLVPAELHTRNPNFGIENDQENPYNGLVIQSGANTDERMFVRIGAFNTYALGLTEQPKQRPDDPDLLKQYEANSNLAWREQSFYHIGDLDLDAEMYLEHPVDPAPDGTPFPGTTGGDDDATPPHGVTIEVLYPVRGENRVDVTTSERATESITPIDVALNKVSKQRADLGAFQNRLELAMEGVDMASENLQASESRIRDADMAKEFVNFTKNQIMSQSAASMTAQANMRAQIILKIIG